MSFNAVVFSPTRTGSHLICDNLSQHFNVPKLDWLNHEFKEGVIHTHDPNFLPITKDTICVLSRRRSIFDSIMSAAITHHSKEVYFYTNKSINPFTVDEKYFFENYKFHKIFYDAIDTDRYAKVVEIYYEDMISDLYYLFSKFDIIKPITLWAEKSPYNYKNIILNYKTLEQKFEQYENTFVVTYEMVETLKKTITQALITDRKKFNDKDIV